nr:type I-MYXAN CRISPR-associated protein Cas6/Cmx6 [Gammaproteobacteria bacterium]
MFWQEDAPPVAPEVAHDVVDVSFRIDCRMLPLDHAHALSAAILTQLPWLSDEERAGIHVIHGAASGNGWMRPEDSGQALLHLSRRARLTLRVPAHRIDDAARLSGATLDIAGHALQVQLPSVRSLNPIETLFARYVITAENQDELHFVEYAADQLAGMGVRVRKLLCGIAHVITTPTENIFTRSVMVAGLNPEESVRLQQQGLGPGRTIGCGLFIPHKGIEPVGSKAQH